MQLLQLLLLCVASFSVTNKKQITAIAAIAARQNIGSHTFLQGDHGYFS
jgi:hypothetical protein